MLTAEDLGAFLGRTPPEEGEVQMETIAAMVRAYTRDKGFDPLTGDPVPEVRAVILTATARLLANPTQLAGTAGPFTVNGGFTGWSLAETQTLNRYRKRSL